MEVKLRLEPLIRLLSNIIAKQAWVYQLLLCGGGYYLVVTDGEAKIWYKISELTPLGNQVYLFTLPNDFITLLSNLGIRVSSVLSLELLLDTDTITMGVTGFENTFSVPYDTWEGYFPEETLLENKGTLQPFSNLSTLYKFSNVSTIIASGGFLYGLEEQLNSLYILPIQEDVQIVITEAKFVYSNLGKMMFVDDKLTLYSSTHKDSVMHGVIKLKLTNKQLLFIQVVYERKPTTSLDEIFIPLEELHYKMRVAPIVNVRPEQVQRHIHYIGNNDLEADDIVLFYQDRKIKVKDFDKLFVKQKPMEVRQLENILYVKGQVATLLTLYEKVEAKHELE